MPSVAEPLIFVGLGDVHRRLDRAADLIRRVEAQSRRPVAFVLQVGDVEAHRNEQDLATMYAPFRDKRVGDFPKYARGDETFPCRMYFIGGNHESYGYLEQEPQGATLAPNLHYLGRVGMVTIEGLRVAYLTGCYDEEIYGRGRDKEADEIEDHEWSAQRALSCFSREEVHALEELPRPHVLLVHEWPLGLVRPEDHEPGEPKHRRLRYGETGVPIIRQIVERIGPRLVLCGHRHRRYSGIVRNKIGDETIVCCLGEVVAGEEGLVLFAFDGRRVQEVPL